MAKSNDMLYLSNHGDVEEEKPITYTLLIYQLVTEVLYMLYFVELW